MGQHLKNENNDGHDAENDQLIRPKLERNSPGCLGVFTLMPCDVYSPAEFLFNISSALASH